MPARPLVAVFMVLIGAIAAALVLGFTTLARATTPGVNGKIAFARYRLQDDPLWSEIYVANSDGTGARRVSHSATPVQDNGARWSPDGRWIAFTRCPSNGASCSVWIVRPDGSGQHRLPACAEAGGCNDSGPSFSPDGKRIVFVRDWGHDKQGSVPNNDQVDHSALLEADLDGNRLTILSRLDGYAGGFSAPVISPNGQLLLFRSYTWNPARLASPALFVEKIDGSGLHRVTPLRLRATIGDWSPDGRSILLMSSASGTNELAPGNNLYTVRPDGTGLQQLTHVGSGHYVLAGSYSPDGKAIVYGTDVDATPKTNGGNTFADVVTAPLAGGPVTQVTHTPNLDGWPSWGSRP